MFRSLKTARVLRLNEQCKKDPNLFKTVHRNFFILWNVRAPCREILHGKNLE